LGSQNQKSRYEETSLSAVSLPENLLPFVA